MRLPIIPLFAAALLLAPAPVPAATLEQVLAIMDTAGPAFRDLSASLKRADYTPVLKETEESPALIWIKRAGPRDVRMLVDIKGVNPRTLAFEKATAEFYYPKMQSVDVYNLGKSRSLVDQFLLLGFGSTGGELKRSYSMRLLGEEQISGETTTRIELVPLDAAVLEHMRKAELWIGAGGYPLQQKIYTSSTEYTFTYSNVKLNIGLPDSALKLQLPRGVKRQYPQK
jgi:outer membrane lipoprotein-sorting protein